MKTTKSYRYLAVLLFIQSIALNIFAQAVNCTGCIGTPPVGLPPYCSVTQNVYNPNFGVTPNSAYNLVFEDNFNGTQINTNYWKIGGNAELDHIGENSCLKEENAFVSNGKLYLRVKNDPNCSCNVADYVNNTVTVVQRNYSSSNLWSKQVYGPGRFEIRCKAPNMMGVFPAFWLYAQNYEGGYNHAQEIDVFEFIQDDPHSNCAIGDNCYDITGMQYFTPNDAAKRIITTYHYAKPLVSFNNRCAWQNCYISYFSNSDLFHDYAVEWDENVIKWYYDNILISTRTRWTNNNVKVENFPNPTALMHVVITNGLRYTTAANNTNNCVSVNNYMPIDLEVEYVKIYSRCQYSKTLCFPTDNLLFNTFDSEGFFSNTINFSNTCQEWTVNSGERLRANGGDISIKNFHAYSGSDVIIKGIKTNCNSPVLSSRLADSTKSLPNNNSPQIINNKLEAIIPNPNSGSFIVKYGASQTGNNVLNIWSINGQLIYSENIKSFVGVNQVALNNFQLATGLYILQISGIQGNLKLMIE